MCIRDSDDGVELTPLISEQQLQKVENYARSGQQAGATAVAGGNRIDREGYFFEATVFDDVKHDMTIAQEEIFGPVLSVLSYKDKEEAIHIANDTAFGLAAGVFTKDIDQATNTVNQLQAGQVYWHVRRLPRWHAGWLFVAAGHAARLCNRAYGRWWMVLQ